MNSIPFAKRPQLTHRLLENTQSLVVRDNVRNKLHWAIAKRVKCALSSMIECFVDGCKIHFKSGRTNSARDLVPQQRLGKECVEPSYL